MEVQNELLTSYAWKHLSYNAKLIYLCCSLQHDLSKRTVMNTPLWDLIKKTNMRLFQMSYDIIGQYMPSLTESEYCNAMNELLYYKFIECYWYTFLDNVYMLFDGWKSV